MALKLAGSFTTNATDITGYDSTQLTYTGTVTWDGTPPTTVVTNIYRWLQIGKLVTLIMDLVYTNAGTANTTVTWTLPTDCPSPEAKTGLTAANSVLNNGSGGIATSTTATGSVAQIVYMAVNAGANGYILGVSRGSVSAKTAKITIQYFAA